MYTFTLQDVTLSEPFSWDYCSVDDYIGKTQEFVDSGGSQLPNTETASHANTFAELALLFFRLVKMRNVTGYGLGVYGLTSHTLC